MANRGAREFLKHGINGWFIESVSSEQLVAAMRQAMQSPIHEMGLAARQAVSAHTLANGVKRFNVAAELAFLDFPDGTRSSPQVLGSIQMKSV